MLVAAIVAACVSLRTLFVWTVRGAEISMLVKMSLFYVPTILFIEAVMYWTIRKRMIVRKDAWTHIIMFIGAYILSFLIRLSMGAIVIMHMPLARQIRTMAYAQIYLFWALVLIAHVFFARVLLKVFAKPTVEEVQENRNLLDDVLD